MIFIYGDSHGLFIFKGLTLPNRNYSEPSITMFRIGRDNVIINYNKDEVGENDTIILLYGEVDCRCHIQRQINIGNNEDDVINELVNNYFQTIKNNITNKNIIISGVVPPTKQNDYESINGPILHDFPFIGTDEDRVRYTTKVNTLLEKMANENNFYYFHPYDYYTRDDGTLKYELSDKIVHIQENSHILNKINEILNPIL
jgi:hypothetical protein